MWWVAFGIAVLLQAGATRAADDESEQGAPRSSGPSESSGEDSVPDEADQAVVPEEAPAKAVVAAPTPSAFATVSFRNDVGKKLRLVEAHFTMDGEKLPTVLSSAEPGKSYVIVSGAIHPGPHVVGARLVYQGDRGVFSYMKGYRFNVKSEQLLTAPANRAVSLTVVGRETTGITAPLERRLVITVEGGTAGR